MMQPMTEPFVIEVWGRLAEVVLKEGDAFRFHAVAPPFHELDGAAFSKPAWPSSTPPVSILTRVPEGAEPERAGAAGACRDGRGRSPLQVIFLPGRSRFGPRLELRGRGLTDHAKRS